MGPIWATHMGSATGFGMGPIWVSPYASCPDGPHMGPIYQSHKEKRNDIIIFILTCFLVYNACLAFTVADTEGIHVVRLNPHLRQNYFIFIRNFNQNQHKLSNNHVQFSNGNLLCKFEPPNKKSWIRPCFNHLFYFIYMGQPIWDPYGTRLHCPYRCPHRLLAGSL